MRVLAVYMLQLAATFRSAVSPVGVHRPAAQQSPLPPPLQARHSGASADGPPWPELGATPMLAYNGWLASTEFMGYNNETLYYKLVDQLVASNLAKAGYTTIVRRRTPSSGCHADTASIADAQGVTCNGWIRDNTTGRLTVHKETWPNGFRALVDYAHAHGVKIGAVPPAVTLHCRTPHPHSICVPAGAYTDTGATNCCRDPLTGKAEPGSYGNEQLDVQTFADYGVDQVNGVVHLYFSPSAGC